MELSEIEREAIYLSLKVSIWAVSWSVPFALTCAWLLARREFIGKNVLNYDPVPGPYQGCIPFTDVGKVWSL